LGKSQHDGYLNQKVGCYAHLTAANLSIHFERLLPSEGV
jgi:hypothetical protein